MHALTFDRRTFLLTTLAAACACRGGESSGEEPARAPEGSGVAHKTASGKRIFITGSASGLGLLAARVLAKQGHRVVLHARNTERARAARAELPDAEAVVIGDVSTIAAIREVAAQVNALGQFEPATSAAGSADGHPTAIT